MSQDRTCLLSVDLDNGMKFYICFEFDGDFSFVVLIYVTHQTIYKKVT